MAEKQQDNIECGFCLLKKEELLEPRTLPCNHTHCLKCLTEFYEENNALVCPEDECGEVFEGSPDTLPSHDMVGEDNNCCDACESKKLPKQLAVIYCTVCCKKFCGQHQESHDEVLSDHPLLSMQEHRAEAMKKQTRNCTKHGDHPYVMGCKHCLNLVCLKCIADPGRCDKGASHSLLPLDDLVATLLREDIIADTLAREDKYEKLCKQTSKIRAEYDNKTSEIIQLIHQIRDAQINALKLKYEKLEDEVMKKRQKSRVDMAEFMEDIVLKKWTRLRNHRKMVESRVRCSHQVDVVKGLKELKDEIQKFVEEEIPKLQLEDEVELKKLSENRAVELEVVSSCDIIFSDEGVTTRQPLPQAMKLLKSGQLPTYPLSVCQCKGRSYVGLANKTITRIDNNNQLHNSFISTSGPVESIAVYKDKLYTLSLANPCVVNVYDMSGGHITSWNHPYHGSYSNMLTVVADQVVIADPPNQRITVYSLTGKSLRHIPCPLLSDTFTTLCAVDNTSVVISNYETSKVFRVNMTTGDVMWTISDVNKPQGLVCYGSYILLAACNNNTIYIRDTTTGKIMSQVADDAIAGGHVFGLGVYDATLLVPLHNSSKVIFYQLNNE